MSLIDKNEIIKSIKEYILEQDDNHGNWYIGLCDEPHCITLNVIKRTSKNWMYIETGSNRIASEVLDCCTNTTGIAIKKDKHKDTKKGSVIYVYKKNASPSD